MISYSNNKHSGMKQVVLSLFVTTLLLCSALFSDNFFQKRNQGYAIQILLFFAGSSGAIALNLFQETSKVQNLKARGKVFRSLEALKDETNLPVLAVIPSTSSSQVSTALQSDYALVAMSGIISHYPIRSLVISSAESKDGKTTAAVQLAKKLSRHERVLIVDTNLRSPQVHTMLGLTNTRGVLECLTSDSNVSELLIKHPSSEHLYVMTAGSVLIEDSEDLTPLLMSQKMAYMADYLAKMFDRVIYDSPSLSEAFDALALSRHVDALVFVVSLNQSSRSTVLKSINNVQSMNIPILGIIANRTKDQINATDIGFGLSASSFTSGRGLNKDEKDGLAMEEVRTKVLSK
jgi:capsular exopolysaccharide synthesis family protein